MWDLLLRMILDTVAENRGIQVEFYNRFQYTVEVSAQLTHSSCLSVHSGGQCTAHTLMSFSAWWRSVHSSHTHHVFQCTVEISAQLTHSCLSVHGGGQCTAHTLMSFSA